MRTRRFENTLREREAVAGGARCRSLGFYSDALPHCLCAPVPARPSGEQPGARGQALPGRGTVRGAVAPLSAAQACRAGQSYSASPRGRATAPQRSRAWVRSGAVRRRASAGF